MTFKKRIFYKIARILGMQNELIPPKKGSWIQDLSTEKIYERVKTCVEKIETIIDVGASDGRWSEAIRPFYQNANYLLIEANIKHKENLDKYVRRNKKAVYELCAGSDSDGVVYFDDRDLFGGLASHEKIDGVKVPCHKIDTLVKKYGFGGKYLLKLDTHGFEVPIIEGSKKTLENTELIIIEVYNFQLTESSLKFWQMCQYMDKLGFSPIGLSEVMYREYDGALWQFDLFFIPKTSSVFKYDGYR